VRRFFIVRRVVASRNVKSHEEPELDTHTQRVGGVTRKGASFIQGWCTAETTLAKNYPQVFEHPRSTV
jgi:hypothetical protein